LKKSDLVEISKAYGLSPNKKLGQNFLVSDEFAERIIAASEIQRSDSVLEIGPGFGALTERLAVAAGSVTAVEIDSGLARYLKEKFQSFQNVEIVHGDFLKYSPAVRFTRIVSNLPYYCSSEIIFRIAADYEGCDAFLMLQKEMARRLVSSPGTPSYGALTVTAGFYFKAELLFNVGKGSFHPSPDVNSSFMAFRRKVPAFAGIEAVLFHKIVKSAFWGRRKTILTSLSESPHMDVPRNDVSEVLGSCGIGHKLRGEDLGLDDFIRLAAAFKNHGGKRNNGAS
jgi:16S rRNA (adenine1518-N6/adenine1519-N6)-dimethyltransferase